jgi:UDP:flavonoid glycosyltransferase YjiC (YdhE family)
LKSWLSTGKPVHNNRGENEVKTILFAVAGYNLAETGRMLEIAKACRGKFKAVFMSYGGQFEYFIEEEGFELIKMEPRLSREKLARLRKVLAGETLNTVGYLSEEELIPRVAEEIKLFGKIRPAAVLTGWCLSVTVSTRAAGVPFVNVLHSTSITEYYQAGLQSWPDRSDFAFLHLLFSEEKMLRWMNKMILSLERPVKPYNAVGKRYGLGTFNNFIELIEGDHTLLADIPELVNLPKLRPNLHHVGPLPFRINAEVPDEITKLPKDKKVVYFAMGSSGKRKLVGEIIEGFEGMPYWVIAPVAAHIEGMNVKVPSNVVVTGFLPAHRVNPLADISVIHGGQNTVMQACLSGTPIVGVGMHPEQQANLDACVRKGFAIRLSKKRVTAPAVLDAIDTLLQSERAKKLVSDFQQKLQQWNGPANAARFLSATFGVN